MEGVEGIDSSLAPTLRSSIKISPAENNELPVQFGRLVFKWTQNPMLTELGNAALLALIRILICKQLRSNPLRGFT